ncbi:MAG: cell division protein FtsQ/DivIB [Planctomycetaceae bacterium]
MATSHRVRRHRRGKRLKKQRETWLQRWGFRIGKGILSLATVGSLALLGFTGYRYFQHSGQLSIGEVRIMGCMHVVESELLDLAQVDFRSNLINLDLQEVSRRLARHPWVEKATVRRDFSGKALIIEVQERVPRALVLLDELYLMDRNGEVFKKAAPGEKLDFPVLTGLQWSEWKQKEPRAMELRQQALDFLDQMRGRKIFPLQEVSEIHLSKKDGLTLYTVNGGIPIRLGWGDFVGKLNRLEKVLPDLRNKWKNVESLALTYSKKVVVKMKESGKEKSPKS